jgi:hypothetical protein
LIFEALNFFLDVGGGLLVIAASIVSKAPREIEIAIGLAAARSHPVEAV